MDEEFFASNEFDEIAKIEFEKFDKDNSGFIDITELKSCLENLNQNVNYLNPGAGEYSQLLIPLIIYL